MKAVNLIPAEERRGAGGTAGRSGGGAYLLIGALALLVIIAGFWAATGKQISDREAEASSLEQRAAAEEAKAAALAPYTAFNTLRINRTQTVRSIAASRFDWAHSLHEVARVVPADVELESLRGTVSPAVQVKGDAGTSTLRGALPNPAIELVGCSKTQSSVARTLVRLRQIDGVVRVSLQNSQKTDTIESSASSSGGASSGDDCRHGDPTIPRYTLAVFFDQVPLKGTPGSAAVSAPQPASAATPAAPTTGATP